MRALVLLLFVCFLLWGVARFSGGSEAGDPTAVEAAAPASAPDEAERAGSASAEPAPPASAPAGTVPPGRFLARPEAPEAPEAPAEPSSAAAPTDDLDWLGDVPSSRPEDRALLAGALLHLGPEEMREVLRAEAEAGRVGDDEVRLYMAFMEAMAGRPTEAHERARSIADADALDPRELACLKAAFDTGASPAPASFGSERLSGRAMALRLAARDAERALAAREHARAAELLTEVLQGELDGPWAHDRVDLARWSAVLREAQEGHRFDPDGDWPSIDFEVRHGDSLSAIRVRAVEANPGLVVNTELIERVNGLGDRYLQPGDLVRVPSDPVRTLVDLSARWVLVFFGDEVAAAYECGIGAQETPTIVGDFVIGTKKENPPWFRVGHEPVPFGDPENPLGTRWLGWFEGDERTSYGFHGTWEPETIGLAASEGCVRFRNEDVEELAEILPRRSPVHVRP